jgi:hypothetical protein
MIARQLNSEAFAAEYSNNLGHPVSWQSGDPGLSNHLLTL